MVKFFLSLLLILNISGCDKKNESAFNNKAESYKSKLQIIDQTTKEKISEFDVAIADSPEKLQYGLMNLDSMPQNRGMLFLFDEKRFVNMWMKNTRISLDMLFVDENDIIVTIRPSTTPQSLEIISSQQPVTKVLEINSGLVEKFHIRIGQKIELREQVNTKPSN